MTREFTCPDCGGRIVVDKDPKQSAYVVQCIGECSFTLRLRIPKVYDEADALCFALDHLKGTRYRFVQVIGMTDLSLDLLKEFVDTDLAYSTSEIAAKLNLHEQQAYDLLWRAYQKKIVEWKKLKKGRRTMNYWLFSAKEKKQ